MAQGGYRSALAHRDFRRLAVALVVNQAGSWAYSVVLLVYLFQRTHSTAWVSAGMLVRFVPGLLLSSFAGVIAERYERRRILLTSTFVDGVAMTGMVVAVALDAPPGIPVALAGLVAAVSTPVIPAVAALTPQLVGERDLVAANAVQATIDHGAVIVGPALGAALLATGEPASGFALNAASYFIAGAIFLRIASRSSPTDTTEEGAGLWRQVTVGAHALREAPGAVAPVMFSVLATVFYGIDTVLYVPLSGHLHASASGYGYLLAAEAAGGVAAAGAVNRLASRPRIGGLIVGGMILYCGPLAVMPLLHSIGPALPLIAIRGAGTLVVDVLAVTVLQRSVPPRLVTRVFGVFETMVIGAAAVGALVAAPALSGLGLSAVLVLVGTIGPALAIAGLPTLLRLEAAARERLAELEPVVALLGRLELFAEADRPALERVAAALEAVDVAPGQVLMREGDVADALYVIADGELVVAGREADGKPLARQMVGEGYVGEIGLLHGIPRTATVRAVTAGHAYRLSADDFRAALSATPASGMLLTTARSRLVRTHPGLTEGEAPMVAPAS